MASELAGLDKPLLLRTYDVPPQPYAQKKPFTCTVAEAARAASATPFYFAPKQCAEHLLIDGGLVAGGPLDFALLEATALWPGKPIATVISVGCGAWSEANMRLAGGELGYRQVLAKLQAGADASHRRTRDWLASSVPAVRYHRTDVLGLDNVGPDACDPALLQQIEAKADEALGLHGFAEELVRSLLRE